MLRAGLLRLVPPSLARTSRPSSLFRSQYPVVRSRWTHRPMGGRLVTTRCASVMTSAASVDTVPSLDHTAPDDIGVGQLVFERISAGVPASAVSYGEEVASWLKAKNFPLAMQIYQVMRIEGAMLDAPTFTQLLNACIKEGELKMLEGLLRDAEMSPHFDMASLVTGGRDGELDPSPFVKLSSGINSREHRRKARANSLFVDVESEDDNYYKQEALLRKRQIDLESRKVDEAVDRYRRLQQELASMGRAASSEPAQSLLVQWYTPFVKRLEKERMEVKDMEPGFDRRQYGPYVLLLPPEKLAVITMHELLGSCLLEANGALLSRVAIAVGRAVQAEVNFTKLKSENTDLWEHLKRTSNGKQMSVQMFNRNLTHYRDFSTQWPVKEVVKLGSMLIHHLIDSARFSEKTTEGLYETENLIPAFRHELVIRGGKYRQAGVLTCDSRVLDVIKNEHSLREHVHARYFPMIVPPKPWRSPHTGGYLCAQSSVMRVRGCKEQMDALFDVDSDLSAIYDSLNMLSSTPWRINSDVFHVVNEAWQGGGGIADLPSKVDLPEPVEPTDVDEKTAWRKSLVKIRKHNREQHSLRCDTTYKVAVAEEFLNEERFYFPHNVDFRGRCYPIPPHLNHMGSDLCRGLLSFHEGRPVGREGLRWLKVQLANLYGKNKVSFDERVTFVEEHLDEIFDSAVRPLDGDQWWLNADDPWQCLATCIELKNVLQSPDPEAFVSHLPVHMDGSCNGLQHYAAMGGDEKGGRAVNLLPGEKPADVYSDVAAIVAQLVARDAANGDELAMKLDGKIERKVVKQTVMTSVYGVTFVGARAQIHNAMKDRDIVHDDDLWAASQYLTKLTFESLEQMFTGAKEIMTWLADCARLVARQGETVAWVTPLGLPVIQPYRKKPRNMVVKTLMQTVVLANKADGLPVSSQRQRSAFPPNYVHSLDSTHMMLTTRRCHDLGITYSSVHDSFWTHASTIPQMSVALREAFVELHSKPLLHDLLAQLQKQHPEVEFPPVPQRGNLELTDVLVSDYFFQ